MKAWSLGPSPAPCVLGVIWATLPAASLLLLHRLPTPYTLPTACEAEGRVGVPSALCPLLSLGESAPGTVSRWS